ncbi:hypothetical protein Tco_1505077 [Tanacetum coccineum]
MKKPSQAPKGVSVGPKVGIKPVKQVYRLVSKKNNVNTGGKKKDAEPIIGVSNSNPFDVLNSVENDIDLEIVNRLERENSLRFTEVVEESYLPTFQLIFHEHKLRTRDSTASENSLLSTFQLFGISDHDCNAGFIACLLDEKWLYSVCLTEGDEEEAIAKRRKRKQEIEQSQPRTGGSNEGTVNHTRGSDESQVPEPQCIKRPDWTQTLENFMCSCLDNPEHQDDDSRYRPYLKIYREHSVSALWSSKFYTESKIHEKSRRDYQFKRNKMKTAMDKKLQDKVKSQDEKHDSDDEERRLMCNEGSPSAGSNQGFKSSQKRRHDSVLLGDVMLTLRCTEYDPNKNSAEQSLITFQCRMKDTSSDLEDMITPHSKCQQLRGFKPIPDGVGFWRLCFTPELQNGTIPPNRRSSAKADLEEVCVSEHFDRDDNAWG